MLATHVHVWSAVPSTYSTHVIRTVSALAVQMKYHERKMKMHGQKEVVSPPDIERGAAQRWMQGKRGDYGEEVLDLLAAYGIPVAASRVAAGKDEAVQYARELGFPVVMKVVSPDVLHKSDAGGVVVGVEQPEQVEENFGIIRDNLLNYKRDARFEGVRIQKMAPEGYDLFMGGKHDPSFGPVVFLGMGGIYIEVFRDVANALCPAGADSIYTRLKRL